MTASGVQTRLGSDAVVVGASMAGLLAARVLAERYDRVTVVERDELPCGDAGRRGVPQGRHVHVLLPRGQQVIDELLPGVTDELVAAGATHFEPLIEMRFSVAGHLLAREPVGARALTLSRALLESRVRRRVGALANVDVIDACDALGLVSTDRRDRITGVRILRRASSSAEEVLGADLVVAATGRGGRVPAWLEGLGYERPAEQRIDTDLFYASRRLRLAPDVLRPDKVILFGARPDLPRGVAMCLQDDGSWLLTLSGFGAAHRPPVDNDGQVDFAASVVPPDVVDAIRTAEPLDGVVSFRFPASVRRRYDRLARFPERLVVAGDAMCSFDPVYGQGMTVAALEALALRRALECGADGLARRYFREARPSLDHAWGLAAGADLAMPWIPGHRPVGVRVINGYVGRLLAAAERDPVVARTFLHVTGMLAPPAALLHPRIAARVMRHHLTVPSGPPALPGRRRVPSMPTEVSR